LGRWPGKDGKVMVNLGSKGAERVKGGSQWSWAIPTLGLILVGVVPPYLKDLYSAYAEQLMKAYVTAGFAFLIAVIGVLSIMVLRDLISPTQTTKTFRFSPEVPASETDELARVKVSNKRFDRE